MNSDGEWIPIGNFYRIISELRGGFVSDERNIQRKQQKKTTKKPSNPKDPLTGYGAHFQRKNFVTITGHSFRSVDNYADIMYQ